MSIASHAFQVASGLVAAIASLALAACGGGSHGDTSFESKFLTADTRGMTTGGFAGDTLAGAPGAAASDAADDLARVIEEADLLRVDGDTLYVLDAHVGLSVVDLAGARVLGRLSLRGVPREMYVGGGRALALVDDPGTGEGVLVDVGVADPAAPAERARIPLGGAYAASRLIGDVLVVAAGWEVRSFLVSGSAAPAPVDAVALPHAAQFAHATDRWMAVSGWDASPGAWGTWATPVSTVDVSAADGSLSLLGTVELPGWVADDRKLDVFGDVLRVVTHSWEDAGLSRLFTVDLAGAGAPSVLATLDVVRGEQLFATRFDGDRAYVVTFERVDPLWVIDLADPAAPRVAGVLTVPGWSTDLIPTGDGRLVGLGVETTDGWHVVASLFDVSNPSAPALLDREDLAAAWSTAFHDPKGIGVFPADGLVTIPLSNDVDRLAVLDLGPTTLALRGAVDLEAPALRAFPHPRGVVVTSAEDVTIADPATFAVRSRILIAENVVDACRLPDGRLLSLVATRRSGRLGGMTLPLVPERMFPHGDRVAVVGWDDFGRAAYVVDFAGPAPVISSRFDLGGAWYFLAEPGAGVASPNGWFGGGGSADAILTPAGRLLVHGLPGGGWEGGGPKPLAGGGGASAGSSGGSNDGSNDGFVVIDVANSLLEDPVTFDGGYVTGFVADGETLVATVGTWASADPEGRPRVRHDLVRVDLVTRAATAGVNVPGFVLRAAGDRAYLAEETWTEGWSSRCSVVAVDLGGAGDPAVLDRLALLEGAYDLRAAGSTLFFATYETNFGAPPPPGPGPLPPSGGAAGSDRPFVWGDGSDWTPRTTIGVVRLGVPLAAGPTIEEEGRFLTILLAEDGAALLVRDDLTVERRDVSGPAAVLDWTVQVSEYPRAARADLLDLSRYLFALGYAGLETFP